MDNSTGAIITTIPHFQLPPIMHTEPADTRHRDRPLLLEPFAPRESYAVAGNSHFQSDNLQQQQCQTMPQGSVSSQPATGFMGSRQLSQEQKRNQEFDEHLRTSADGTQHTGDQSSTSASTKLMLPICSGSGQSEDNRPSILTPSPQPNCSLISPTPNGNSSEPNSNRPYPPKLPWSDDIELPISAMVPISKIQTPPSPQSHTTTPTKAQKVRRKWTDQETRDLLSGCSIHGVGNWKKVLDDARFKFNNRSSVDLKDRFRTCFPEKYKYFQRNKSETPGGTVPGGKPSELSIILVGEPEGDNQQDTGKQKGRSRRRSSNSPTLDVAERLGFPKSFPKAQRRERNPFSVEEDTALLQGFEKYGPSWSKIQADKDFHLLHRRSTDLRDRFRNAYPEKYAQAGFKARPKHPPKPPRSGPCALDDLPSEDLNGVGRESRLSSVEARHQFDNAADVSALEDFGLGTASQLDDHHNDDGSRKDDFNVSMMQEFLGANSVRDWENNDSMTGNGASLFSSNSDGRNTPPPVTTSMSVGSTLAEDFGASSLAHYQQDLFHSPGGNGKNDAHDLVRWEDMVTHPIFSLETPPSQGVGGVSMGMDGSVTLAPINSLLGGGSVVEGNSGTANAGTSEGVDSVVPALSALLEEISNGNIGGGTAGVGVETTARGGSRGGAGAVGNSAAGPKKRKQNTTPRIRKRKGKAEQDAGVTAVADVMNQNNPAPQQQPTPKKRRTVKKKGDVVPSST